MTSLVGTHLLLFEGLASPVLAAGADSSSTKDTVETIGAVIAGLVALVGAPAAFLNFRKTQVEIRKLELEARQLEGSAPSDYPVPSHEAGYRVTINESRDVNVQILADPRFLGPLLLLLDFIVAWIILTFAGYATSVLSLGYLEAFVVAALGIFLLVPILREARRVKRQLAADGSAPNRS